MIRALEKVKTEDVVFIDIETVAAEKELKIDTPLYDAWAYKARYQNEINRKTGAEYSIEDYFQAKAALYAPFAKVVDITIGKIIEKEGEPVKIVLKSYYGDDEKDLLERFNNDLIALNGKNSNLTLCGLNNIGFDEPFLFKRMLINQIIPSKLIDSSGLKPWDVKSIDLGKIFQGSSFYPDSLVAIATAMGLPSPKDGIDGSQVTEFYYDGKLPEIVAYCEKDVITTANIFRRMRFEEVISDENVEVKKGKEKPAPVLQRLYMSKRFSGDIANEIKEMVVKKDLTEEEKKHLGEIILSVYIAKNDKVGEKKIKNQEVADFIATL